MTLAERIQTWHLTIEVNTVEEGLRLLRRELEVQRSERTHRRRVVREAIVPGKEGWWNVSEIFIFPEFSAVQFGLSGYRPVEAAPRTIVRASTTSARSLR